MASTPFLRFLALLLLLLPPALREYLPAIRNDHRPSVNDAGVLDDDLRHPIVLVPGATCSELGARLTDDYRPSVPRCGAMNGQGWFGLWQNTSDLAAHHYQSCFLEQMSLVYDSDANDYRNIPGLETRVLNFGTSTGFHSNPVHPDWCLESLRHELERMGYCDGETLFGAPYDLRHAPPIPGQPSEVYFHYFHQLMMLIENASRTSRKKAILFGHSLGGMVALQFVRAMPVAWREQYIKHLVLVAPLPATGGVTPVRFFVSGTGLLAVPATTELSTRPMWRTLETAIVSFPSPVVFGDRPLVITKRRNYTAHDMDDLLTDIGASAAVEPFRRREVPRSRYFEAPMVPVTCINGVGIDTPEQLMYWDGDFDAAPELVYGDGDNTINLASMLAFDEHMSGHPGQREQFKTIKLHGATHGEIVTEKWPLQRVVQEILEANRI